MVGWDGFALVGLAVLVRDLDFVDGMRSEPGIVSFPYAYSWWERAKMTYPKPLIQCSFPTFHAYRCFSLLGAGNLEILYTALALR